MSVNKTLANVMVDVELDVLQEMTIYDAKIIKNQQVVMIFWYEDEKWWVIADKERKNKEARQQRVKAKRTSKGLRHKESRSSKLCMSVSKPKWR